MEGKKNEFLLNVEHSEKEIVIEKLKKLENEFFQLENILSGINEDYNEYLLSFPNNQDDDFLKMKNAFKIKVEKEKEKVQMEITIKTASVSNVTGAN